jgi:hypothetical protein
MRYPIILFILIVVLFIIVVETFIWQKYPFGVKQYRTIKLGMDAAEKVGDSTGWAPPYDEVWEESEFFVYSLGDETMCIQSDCGIGGYFIECLGGWISGYKDMGDVADYGLRDVGVDINKQKIITVANKNGKIVGIYPGASIRNLPYIMRNHRNLISKEVFEGCSNLLPSLWK